MQNFNITIQSERVAQNPNMPDADNMDHWRCVLRRKGRRMTVHFSQGFGHNGKEPSLDAVLECLSLDAGGIENARDFDDWCAEYGYDTDSRTAERTYRACQRSTKRLAAFLGPDDFSKLLWEG